MGKNERCGSAGCQFRQGGCGLSRTECCEFSRLASLGLAGSDRQFLRYIELGDKAEASFKLVAGVSLLEMLTRTLN